jgi:hypothetical protein
MALKKGLQQTAQSFTPPSEEAINKEQDRLEQQPSTFVEDFGNAFSTAVEQHHVIDSVARGANRSLDKKYEDASDTSFDAHSVDLSEYDQRQWSTEDVAYLRESESQDDMRNRISYVEEDKGRAETIQSYGLGGAAAEVTAAILDPVGWAVGAATGPIGISAKVGKVANVLRSASIAAGEGAVIESFLIQNDTQRGIDEIGVAAVGSFVLGGALGALTRKANPELADATDELDELAADANARNMYDEHAENAGRASYQIDEPANDIMDTDSLDALRDEALAKQDTSAGAAQVEGTEIAEEAFVVGDEEMYDSMAERVRDSAEVPVHTKGFNVGSGSTQTSKVQSAYASIDHSQNGAFRSIGRDLLENPQGNRVPEETAAILKHKFETQMQGAGKNGYNEGYNAWMKSQGGNIISRGIGRNREEFDKLVRLEVDSPNPSAPASVKQAAKGFADQMEMGLKIRKDNDVVGFENVQTDRTYAPVMIKGRAVDNAVSRTSPQAVRRTMSKAYQTGRHKIPAMLANKIAKVQYNRAIDSTLSAKQAFDGVFNAAEKERIIAELRSAGVDDRAIRNLVEETARESDGRSMSNRAKSSLHMNINAQVGDVKMIDLLDNDMGILADGYIKEAAGDSAMARKGFRTQEDFERQIDAAERAGRNNGQDAANAKHEADILRDAAKLIYGQSLEGENSEGFRRLRGVTASLRLQNVGFAQIPEMARITSVLGFRNAMASVPQVGFFWTRSKRAGNKIAGEHHDEVMRDMESLVGFPIGEDNAMAAHSVHREAIGDDAGEGFGQAFDSVMAGLGRVGKYASGFQQIQGNYERVAMRGIYLRMADAVQDGNWGKFAKSMDEAGLDEAFRKEFTKTMKANPKTLANGRKGLDFNAMTPEARETLITGMHRISGRVVQKNFIGDNSVWMSTTLGKMMTQFKSFSITSIEKQAVHDVQGDKTIAALIFMQSTMFAGLAYTAKHVMKSGGQDDPQAYLDEKFEAKNLGWGIATALPQVAGLNLAGDALASLNMLPDAAMAQRHGEVGYSGYNIGSIAPALGLGQDVAEATHSLVDLMKGDGDGYKTAEKWRKLAPLANSIGVAQTMQQLTNQLK